MVIASFYINNLGIKVWLDVVAHAFNASTQEALCEFEASPVYMESSRIARTI